MNRDPITKGEWSLTTGGVRKGQCFTIEAEVACEYLATNGEGPCGECLTCRARQIVVKATGGAL